MGLASLVEQSYETTRPEQPFCFESFVTDWWDIKTDEERQAITVANAYDRLAALILDRDDLPEQARLDVATLEEYFRGVLPAPDARLDPGEQPRLAALSSRIRS